MVTLKTGLALSPEEGRKLQNRLGKINGVVRVVVLYPDRVLVTYDNPRVHLATLKAAVNARDVNYLSVNRK